MSKFISNISNKIRAVSLAALILVLTVGMTGCLGNNKKTEETQSESSAIAESSMDQTDAGSISQDQTGIDIEEAEETDQEVLESQDEEGSKESKADESDEETSVAVKGVVAIDPGHQGSWVDMSAQEPYAPGSSKTKAKATSGTQGKYTGINEYELNLDIGLMLRDELEERGYEVVMIREDNDTAISNSERAQKANESGADITVRLHADGSDDTSISGASALIPSADNEYVGYLHDDSKDLAEDILDTYCDETGMNNRGLSLRDDLTGTNWSTIPVALLEMGFMSNKSDDENMADDDFREKMVKGIADGIEKYFEDHPTKSTDTIDASSSDQDSDEDSSSDSKSDKTSGSTSDNAQDESSDDSNPYEGKSVDEILAMIDSDEPSSEPGTVENAVAEISEDYLASSEDKGEKWAVTLIDLQDGSAADYNGDEKLLSASVLKVFIMAAAYENALNPDADKLTLKLSDSDKKSLKSLIEKMITVSDNASANSVVEKLGQGDFSKGMKVVNQFCKDNGFENTSIGRKFLGSNANGDNYTSSNDCAALLESIYNGSCVSQESSDEMLEYLKAQEKTNKIPAGLTSFSDVTTANKTGELSGSTGVVENDIAIVWGAETDYALCIFSNDISSNSSAIDLIKKISKTVYQEIAE